MPGLDSAELLIADACAREPIHIIGQIQSHGLLLAVCEPELVVQQVSTNVASFLGEDPEAVLGRSLESVLGSRQFDAFCRQVRQDDVLTACPLRVVIGGSAPEMMDCISHREDGVLVVELELVRGSHSLEPLDIAEHIRIPLSRMERAADNLELARLAAREVRTLSGFDRVMIYRFDDQWNGDVIAESADASSTSYLGLRFPASDIPVQARKLFLTNRLRAIADVTSFPVPIVPEIGPLTGRPLDLSRSVLRSAASIHIQYLRNMGVGSSMTVSIIVNDGLWGMIACHSRAAHRVDYTTRSVCELIGQVLASQVALRNDNDALQSRLASRRRIENSMAVEESKTVETSSFPQPRLFELLDADGLVSRIDGVVAYQGAAVEEASLLPVIGTLQKLSRFGVASSNMLGALDRSAEAYSRRASGALYLDLAEGGGLADYVLFLRRGLVETVNWAGNPDKAVTSDPAGTLSPRNSFAAWRQTVRGRSRRWSDGDLEAASFLRERILRQREALRLSKSEERVRYLAEHDSLTGLFSRGFMELEIERCIREAEIDGSSFGVLFIDLDNFKHFNDTFGHAVGDQILTIVAKRMRNRLRADAVVGRWGGDEFVVLVPEARAGVLAAAATRILHSIQKPLEIEGNASLTITASAGLSRYPVDGTTSTQLLSGSDRAMYGAKRGGGNSFHVLRDDAGAAAEESVSGRSRRSR